MPYKHFTLESRIKLEGFLNAGLSIPKCARLLGIHESSVYREVGRNALIGTEIRALQTKGINLRGHISKPQNKYFYLGKVANAKALSRRSFINQCHHKLTDIPTPLSEAIERYLKKRWSPEQISNRLKLGKISVNGICEKIIIAVQTIYDWIYEFRKDLRRYLRHNRGYRHNRMYYINKKRRKERQLEKGIDNRPKEVDFRKRIGDWEGDTVLGKDHGSTGRIETFTERKTGFLIARIIHPLSKEEAALPEDEQELNRLTMAMRFADGAVDAFNHRIKPKYLKTLTLDNGTENNGYEWIERGIPQMKVYFAHAYHSWERGTNENTNGLLRQYFPKGMDFREITQADLDKVVDEINNRPRKRLGWKSPQEKMWQNAALIPRKKLALRTRI